MSKWEKLPALPACNKGCLNCGPLPQVIDLEASLAVGFGDVSVTKDGEVLWNGDDPNTTVDEFEKIAQEDPDHDYRIHFEAPLYSATYQRQDINTWILVEKGQGFA